MPRHLTNWKKLYGESQDFLKHANFLFEQLKKLNDDLEKKHAGLNKEFDKAVEINKKFQHTIIEQRGVINYLEGKINGN